MTNSDYKNESSETQINFSIEEKELNSVRLSNMHKAEKLEQLKMELKRVQLMNEMIIESKPRITQYVPPVTANMTSQDKSNFVTEFINKYTKNTKKSLFIDLKELKTKDEFEHGSIFTSKKINPTE